MTPAKKAPTPPKAATPSAKAPASPQDRETASAAPSDPGPPPMIPVPGPEAVNYWPARQIYESGRLLYSRVASLESVRENVMAVDVFRMPPSVQQYKAEVLAWVDAWEAHARIKNK